jgi:hypothetical protein
MNGLAVLLALTAANVVGGSVEVNADNDSRVLEEYIHCIGRKSLQVAEVSRRPEYPKFRPVRIAESLRMVSVASGYSANYAAPDGHPVLNAKFEMSKISSAAADREVVRAQMRSMSDKRPAGAPPLRESSLDGIDILALYRAGGGHEIIAFYSIFVPAKSVIATVYMLGPNGQLKGHDTAIAAEAYREKIMDEVISCMKSF